MQPVAASRENVSRTNTNHHSSRRHMQKTSFETDIDWLIAKHYYGRTIFVVLRGVGAFAALFGILFEAGALSTSCWYYGKVGNATHEETGILEHLRHEDTHDIENVATWQKVTIGLVIATIGCGALGFVLNVRGLCGKHLQQRLYYSHSSGEIYFVGGVCSLTVALVYPTFVVQAASVVMTDVHMGFSYFFNLAGSTTMLFCTFCVMVDEVIQMLTSPQVCDDLMSTIWQRRRRKNGVASKGLATLRVDTSCKNGNAHRSVTAV